MDVERVAPELVARDAAGRPYTVRYHLLIPMLVNELQRIERDRDTQVADLERRLAQLERARTP